MAQSNRQSFHSVNSNNRTEFTGRSGILKELMHNIIAVKTEEIMQPMGSESARLPKTSLRMEGSVKHNRTMTDPEGRIFGRRVSDTICYEEAENNTDCCKNGCGCVIF